MYYVGPRTIHMSFFSILASVFQVNLSQPVVPLIFSIVHSTLARVERL